MPLKSDGYMTLLFVNNIQRSREFYESVLGLEFEHGDDNSASFILGPDALVLLENGAADDLLSPADVERDAVRGAKSVIVTSVDDVDALYDELRAKGVEFIHAPQDRWWGSVVRTSRTRTATCGRFTPTRANNRTVLRASAGTEFSPDRTKTLHSHARRQRRAGCPEQRYSPVAPSIRSRSRSA